MHDCATCQFEEFFLSSWAVGDPAMVVDVPANAINPATGKVRTGPKATKALYPDDPSNVYHSYIGDHVKFRILHAGTNITHVHHLHAHQWLHTPNNDNSSYLDSQMISPGGCYTLEIAYGGSGNRNQTVGDSIFHCHFYPHFAQGMWSLWRVHDVFEGGTALDTRRRPLRRMRPRPARRRDRTGTPIPALVPMPTLPMAPMPGHGSASRRSTCPAWPAAPASAAEVDMADPQHRQRPATRSSSRASPATGRRTRRSTSRPTTTDAANPFLNGGLPRLLALKETARLHGSTGCLYEKHNRWDFTKFNDSLKAVRLAEAGDRGREGRDGVPRASGGTTPSSPTARRRRAPSAFVLNGLPPISGAPYADPAVAARRHAGVSREQAAVPACATRPPTSSSTSSSTRRAGTSRSSA